MTFRMLNGISDPPTYFVQRLNIWSSQKSFAYRRRMPNALPRTVRIPKYRPQGARKDSILRPISNIWLDEGMECHRIFCEQNIG
jgi:hypothetical protein